MRICDIISYLGKDRQDAKKAGLISREEDVFGYGVIGRVNAEIINNLSVNIIENSYGKPYISMSSDYFEALSAAKKSNYEEIYLSDAVKRPQDAIIRPMFGRMYEKLVRQVKDGDRESPVFKHHIEPINSSFYHREKPYIEESPDIIVTDYIAAMTGDYFVDLHRWLFPDKDVIKYHGYFE